jgi:hypothetical protein
MLYKDETVRAEYSSVGIPELTDETWTGTVLVFRTIQGHLHDVTREVLNAPELMLPVQSDERHQLRLSTYSVRSGRDSYTLSVSGMSNIAVRVMYSVDDRTLETFDAWLDESGTIEFPVSENVRPGTYKFLAVKPIQQDHWFKANSSLVVLPSNF